MDVREVREEEREWLRATLRDCWSGDTVLGRDREWRPAALPALVAVEDGGERAGIATWTVERDTADLVTLNALVDGRGVGRMLIDAVARAARDVGARHLRVMTTNDNLQALRLYQRAGFRLVELRPGAVDEARLQKPSIPPTGGDGIPIRDELDLVRELA
jgi:ribosomal protein S18 acetylase RimI-like enzyme